MEERLEKLTDLLKDRALGGAGTDATRGGNRSDAEPWNGNSSAEIQDYWEGRRLANRIAERRRLKRKAGETIVGDRDLAGSYDDREELAADEQPVMTIDEAVAIFLGSLGMERDATEGDRRVTRAAR